MEYAEILGPAAPKRTLDRWQPPRDELIKINLDGAFTPGNSYSGWGIAARDAYGTLLVARAGRKEQVTDAFGAELHALAAAVTTATEIGAIGVIFETDSQLLVEAMDVSRADASPYAVIIEDLKYQLKIWFAYWNITVCKRNVNTVAHELAQIGSRCAAHSCVEWDSIVPPNVASCVLGDMPERGRFIKLCLSLKKKIW